MSIEANFPPFNAFGLSLRAIRNSDAQQWFEYLRIPEVMQLTHWHIPSAKDLIPFINQAPGGKAGPIVHFALVCADTGKLAGTIGFHSMENSQGSAEIAYDLTPAYWGRGIATAACATVAAWGFDTLKLNRIQGSVMVGNRASARVLEKCGFTLEGTVREVRYTEDVPSDFWIYSHLRRTLR